MSMNQYLCVSNAIECCEAPFLLGMRQGNKSSVSGLGLLRIDICLIRLEAPELKVWVMLSVTGSNISRWLGPVHSKSPVLLMLLAACTFALSWRRIASKYGGLISSCIQSHDKIWSIIVGFMANTLSQHTAFFRHSKTWRAPDRRLQQQEKDGVYGESPVGRGRTCRCAIHLSAEMADSRFHLLLYDCPKRGRGSCEGCSHLAERVSALMLCSSSCCMYLHGLRCTVTLHKHSLLI